MNAHDLIEDRHPNTDPAAVAWDGNCLEAIIWSREVAESLEMASSVRVEWVDDSRELSGGGSE